MLTNLNGLGYLHQMQMREVATGHLKLNDGLSCSQQQWPVMSEEYNSITSKYFSVHINIHFPLLIKYPHPSISNSNTYSARDNFKLNVSDI